MAASSLCALGILLPMLLASVIVACVVLVRPAASSLCALCMLLPVLPVLPMLLHALDVYRVVSVLL